MLVIVLVCSSLSVQFFSSASLSSCGSALVVSTCLLVRRGLRPVTVATHYAREQVATIHKVLPCKVRPCKVCPCKVRPCKVRPCKVHPCKVRPCKVRPCKVHQCIVRPWKFSFLTAICYCCFCLYPSSWFKKMDHTMATNLTCFLVVLDHTSPYC